MLLSAPLMPPNQHIIGGCNQIISLRFGFPNSFPKLPSADRSLAFRMRGERWREANDLRRNLNNREKGDRRGGVEEGPLIFLTRKLLLTESTVPTFMLPRFLQYTDIYCS